MVICGHFALRIGRKLHPHLEIPLLALTELDLDRHLTPRFSDRGFSSRGERWRARQWGGPSQRGDSCGYEDPSHVF